MSPKVKVFLITAVAVVISSIGEALAAKAMKAIDDKAPLLEQLRSVSGDWHIWVGLILLVSYILLYIYSLALAELSVILPLSASSYLFGILLSKYYLQEDVKPGRWIGTFIIIAGVLVVAWSSVADKAEE